MFDDSLSRELAQAAVDGDIDAIESCIERGADVNIVGKRGLTPLLLAYAANNKIGYRSLLEHGADPDAQDDEGNSVTSLAALDPDRLSWLQLALDHGADPDLENPQADPIRLTLLMVAIDMGNIDHVRALIEAGADVDKPNGYGTQPLIDATIRSFLDITYVLLENGADCHIYSENMHENIGTFITMKPREVLEGDEEIWFDKVLVLLKERGVDVEAQQAEGAARSR